MERIGADAHGIRQSADATIGHLDTIKSIGSAEVIVEAEEAEAEQENIIALAEDIKSQLPNVRDAVPWWAALMSKSVTAAAILGVAFLCWHLGVGHLLKRLFWAVGLFIPKNAIRSAEMDIKVETNALSSSEAVAARRGADPAYEAARKRVKKTKGIA